MDKEEPQTAEEKTPINYDELSAEELLPLAEKGDAEAQLTLGSRYYLGKGAPKDYQEAAKWTRRAAEQGMVKAQYSLGLMYDLGQGVVPQNYQLQLAVKWFRRAAEQGFAKAQRLLGHKYRQGQGVPQDSVLAYKWYNLAAAQGSKLPRENKDELAKQMNSSQIQEAQRLAREFKPKKENP